MPEIKNQFTGGKMNKDLDERLVPKGEYRDAMNIQVSTSEDSEVGTVQNILGNTTFSIQGGVTLSSNAKTVGSVSDEKNDTLYYLVRDEETNYILSWNGVGNINLVFVDYHNVLGFTAATSITGINIIDDMLFWTDRVTEPKKINIPRSITGTFNNGVYHTRLINPDQSITWASDIDITEEHITVIRKAPLTAPQLDMVGEREGNSYADFEFSFTGFSSGDEIDLTIITTVNYIVGDILLIKYNDGHSDISPITLGDIRVIIDDINGNTFTCSILSISNIIVSGLADYSCDLDKSYEKLYKLKFPRFAIRYKYQDGEYSSFGPFSEAAFMPGSWNESTEKVSYLPNTGYNLGMENKLRELTLKNIIPANIPHDVKQVDIIYKESNSPNVYVIDEIKQNDTYWTSNSYLIQQENIKIVLPSNQLLRPWDNVPKTALAQDITGNRIVYGNYDQNYDIDNFRANFNVNLRDRKTSSMKSIKSLREYQLGVVYTDKYNRQTPVLTDTTGSLSVSKIDSSKTSQIEIRPNHTPPSWATHHKFYIKETSTEYYNLSLDRYWDAEDGNIWLSFASNDRDKTDLETFLYLKKRYNSDEAEMSFEKYKILDIKNEAPEYIQTRRSILGKAYNNTTHPLSVASSQVFSGSSKMPVTGNSEIAVQVGALTNTLLDNFHKRQNSPSAGDDAIGGGPLANNVLFMRIGFSSNGGIDLPYKTNWYEIDNVSKTDGEEYLINLNKPLGEDDANWTLQPGATTSTASDLISTAPNSVAGSLVLEIGQDIVQNKSVFQGRFFVKILRDEYIDDAIVNTGAYQNLQVIATADCGYLKNMTQQDVLTTGAWNHDAQGYAAEITSFNNSGPQYTLANYSSNVPDGVPVPPDSYWGHSIWQRISAILEGKGSRWVIDEAFAVGEEPLWNYGPNNTAETDFFGSGGFLAMFDRTKIYGGYHSHSANPSTIQHNETPTGTTVPLVPNKTGLGHGSTISAYEYFSTGAGVTPFTIDISYIGPGRRDIGDAADVYADTSPNTSFINTYDAQYTATGSYWNNYYTISNGITGWNNGIGNDTIAQNAQKFANNLVPGSIVRFTNDPNQILYKIEKVEKFYKSNYAETLTDIEYPFADEPAMYDFYTPSGTIGNYLTNSGSNWRKYYNSAYFNRRITFRLTLECVLSPGAQIGTTGSSPGGYDPLFGENTTSNTNLSGVSCPIEILSTDYFDEDDVPFPENPAIFETEPKDNIDLDIFHEVTDTIPLQLTGDNGYTFAPVGTVVSTPHVSAFGIGSTTTVVSWNGNIVELLNPAVDDNIPINAIFTFTRNDGSYTVATYTGLAPPVIPGPSDTSFFVYINSSILNNPVGLGWNNCYSFGNGVESNRIRDTFNSVMIDKGPKVSATIDEVYQEENRKYGLIYSGIYNSTAGINNLNQFIQAEKITKDLSPTYGSVQKLYAGWGQGGDLLAFCEDRVLKILADKDALYNADGDTNITSTNNVLGTATPYSGEYGISKNPESFAAESYRAYFTDKVRGSVMRLSMDGLTPISEHGMKDWFRDNLKLNSKLLGSYDDKKDEYNVTLEQTTERIPKTVSFKEDVKGWVSFKSFAPENAISCANEYYTFKNGQLWKHHNESVDRNTFYGNFDNSTINVVLNDAPGSVKSFHTLNYEGSQSKVNVNLTDGEYYNLQSKDGWHVERIKTNKQKGTIDEFIEKEGKWFNHIKGESITHDSDTIDGNPITRISIDEEGNSNWE